MNNSIKQVLTDQLLNGNWSLSNYDSVDQLSKGLKQTSSLDKTTNKRVKKSRIIPLSSKFSKPIKGLQL